MEWAEQVDYRVPSHAHSTGDLWIIFDMLNCSKIISKIISTWYHSLMGQSTQNYP